MKYLYYKFLILVNFLITLSSYGVLGGNKETAKNFEGFGVVHIPIENEIVYRSCVLIYPNVVLIDLNNTPITKELLNSKIQLDKTTKKVKNVYLLPNSHENFLVLMSVNSPFPSPIKTIPFTDDIAEKKVGILIGYSLSENCYVSGSIYIERKDSIILGTSKSPTFISCSPKESEECGGFLLIEEETHYSLIGKTLEGKFKTQEEMQSNEKASSFLIIGNLFETDSDLSEEFLETITKSLANT